MHMLINDHLFKKYNSVVLGLDTGNNNPREIQTTVRFSVETYANKYPFVVPFLKYAWPNFSHLHFCENLINKS